MLIIHLQIPLIIEFEREVYMKVEQYIKKYIEEHDISVEKVKNETGLDLDNIFEKNDNLLADDFLRLCVYLGITPEEIGDQIL